MAAETPDPVHLARPLQGTDSVRKFSHGNTYPAIALPFPFLSSTRMKSLISRI